MVSSRESGPQGEMYVAADAYLLLNIFRRLLWAKCEFSFQSAFLIQFLSIFRTLKYDNSYLGPSFKCLSG